MADRSAPGWYGKLPVLGDFASRRLDQSFVDVWDNWLASSMLALRERSRTAWLEGYLASPSWRFLLMPGVLDGDAGVQSWAGVLMPSVDRVGRYFPFTIAQPLGAGLVPIQQMPSLWQWLGELDDLAADAMHEDWSIERLDDALRHIGVMDCGGQLLPMVMMPKNDTLLRSTMPLGLLAPARWIDQGAQTLWSERAHGTAYWYACAGQTVPRLLRSNGLPNPSSMHMMFGSPLD